jgi:SAM-dependent methyltransferase
VSKWPGAEKWRPRRSSYNWSLREPLARWLEEEGRNASGLRVLDVGCGEKPYLAFFSTAKEYVCVDIGENPNADLQGSIEQLPVDDASFDLVLCTQVLEHVDDPARAVRELHRVVRPGGRVLVATHGTYPYHPGPVDYWRWTHTGLARLFKDNAEWRTVAITSGAGTSAALGLLLALYIDLLAQRAHLVWAGRLVIYGINTAAAALDRHLPALRELTPGSLTIDFHIVAER